jgi:AhpD family alkylhydroperoxidase
MSDYHERADLTLLPKFKELAPMEFAGFVELDSIVGRTDGAIPAKYRELMAIAVACTTQCPYCLDVHTKKAKRPARPAKRLPRRSSSPRRCARALR